MVHSILTLADSLLLTPNQTSPLLGTQPPVSLDRHTDASFGNAADDPYNVTYYKRDTGRRYTSDPASKHRDIEAIKLALLPADDPRVQQAKEEFEKGPGSSVGNKGVFATGKTEYDPTGLRATMSTTWEATEKSLDENMPDHVSHCSVYSFHYFCHGGFTMCLPFSRGGSFQLPFG